MQNVKIIIYKINKTWKGSYYIRTGKIVLIENRKYNIVYIDDHIHRSSKMYYV